MLWTIFDFDPFGDDVPMNPPAPYRAPPTPDFWSHDHIPVFVYGTLRPGFGNFPIIEPAIAAGSDPDGIPAMAVGDIGFPVPNPGGHMTYPAANFTGNGRVVGDLLIVDRNHDAFWDADRMETGAGFDRGMVSVRRVLTVEDDGEPKIALSEIVALVWAWPDRPYDLIMDGDWGLWVESRRQRSVLN